MIYKELCGNSNPELFGCLPPLILMKSENVSECPAELARIISIVNKLPEDGADLLMQIAKLREDFNKEVHGPNARRVRIPKFDEVEMRATLIEDPRLPMREYFKVLRRMESCQPEYYEKLLNIVPATLHEDFNTLPGLQFTLAVEELQSWISERSVLFALVRGYRHTEEFRESSVTDRGLLRFPLPGVFFGFDNSDAIVFPGTRSLTILNTNTKLIRRIRECPICNRLYWAKRLGGKRNESSTCQAKRCSDNFHQRKRRIRELEEALRREQKTLTKFRKNLSPSNSLLTDQQLIVSKLEKKMEEEKKRNGDL